MKTVKKVIVLGSGALKIGEAGEFDYAGSQAIKALKEEGITTVLVNPNIATIQTSKLLADTVYFLPVNPFFVEEVIKKEKPDGILLSFGGQTALNCGIALYTNGVLKKHNVQILGTPMSAILLSEDRKAFAEHLRTLGVQTPASKTAKNTQEALAIGKDLGFPVMVRAGFALGGQGSGIAKTEEELQAIAEHAFSFVSQILVEQYLHHYKEVEYEVVRDNNDNCITVCNMENMDPLGIHTGESIVVAPSQTLNNYEYHYLRSTAIKIVRSLKIVGECNVQFALNPNPQNGEIEYYVIELNARLSRSSALASKATGYPLAYVAAKLSLGKNLTQLKNKITKVTQSCYEPALDYIVVKLPRWDMEKFKNAEDTIGSSMKSVGEVMGIGRTFAEAYQKAIRMLDLEIEGATDEKVLAIGNTATRTLEEQLQKPTPKRMFAIAKALREGMSVKQIHSYTGIDPWFLYRIKHLVTHEQELTQKKVTLETLPPEQLRHLKEIGFSDKRIGSMLNTTGLSIRAKRKELGIVPSVFQIDTLAGEFKAHTNYLYMTYNGQHHDIEPTKDKGVIVLGSGPYRIGSSVEFDWTCVNTVNALKKYDKQSIVINCNPETVSTDYDVSNKLYFEELTFERIADIYDFEDPFGIVISVGGQTPNNRAQSLKDYGAHILGTDTKDIDSAEDRSKFSKLLDDLKINQPAWDKFSTIESAIAFANKVDYPVLIRPSYVLSGAYMKLCFTEEELATFVKTAASVSQEFPITVSKFIEHAKEIEVDCVAAKGEVKLLAISEHVEHAGVHSGDASILFPSQTLNETTRKEIERIARSIAKALHITGPVNIQCMAKNDQVYVIEVNLRSSRTFPFISKVTGVNFIEAAVDAFFDAPIKEIIFDPKDFSYVGAKAAQFSFARLHGADPILDVEMSSTGEVACFGEDKEEAYLKAALSIGVVVPQKGIFLSIGGDQNKKKFLKSAKRLKTLGVPMYATENTAKFLNANGIKTQHLYKIHEDKSPNCLEIFKERRVDFAVNIFDQSFRKHINDDYMLRRSAVDHNIPIYTNMQKAELFIKGLAEKKLTTLPIKSWDEYVK